jgi:hypothetical protein
VIPGPDDPKAVGAERRAMRQADAGLSGAVSRFESPIASDWLGSCSVWIARPGSWGLRRRIRPEWLAPSRERAIMKKRHHEHDEEESRLAEGNASNLGGTVGLSIDECERRLAAGGVGILALSGVAAPALRPVNFVLRNGTVILRTGEGSILEAAQFAEPASFVIFEVDRFEHTGWSVVVTGKLARRSALGDLSDLPLRPWARADKHHLVGLSIEEISGRRIGADPLER